MPVEVQATPSKAARYTAYAFTALFTLFMLMDAGVKFTHADAVVKANTQLGFPMSLTPAIGVLALVLLILYLIPSTSVLGAILFTGYFGGAIALHLRVDNPLFSYTLFPIYIALFCWGGLWLSHARLRELFPVTNPPAEPPASKGARITGYVLTGVGAALVLFTAVMKFVYVPPAGAPELYPKHHIHHLGYIEIVCTLLYLFPRTSVLGAVLLSGYLGGATCINLLSGDSLGISLVPVLFCVIPWLGLWLRDLRLRALIPVSR
ncbi:MAG: DoxX family protein [Acidobacteria bacterium]|nr:DoxX family protein [Acidobacteriota bacterium]